MHQDVWHGAMYVSSMLGLHHNDLLYDFLAHYEEISNARARETQQSLTQEEPGQSYSVTVAKRIAFIICSVFLLSLLIAQDHNPTSWLATLLWGSLHGINPAEYMLVRRWLRDIQMYHSKSANSVPFFWSPTSYIYFPFADAVKKMNSWLGVKSNYGEFPRHFTVWKAKRSGSWFIALLLLHLTHVLYHPNRA